MESFFENVFFFRWEKYILLKSSQNRQELHSYFEMLTIKNWFSCKINVLFGISIENYIE